MSDYTIDYMISTHPSKYGDFQSKKGKNGIVKTFISTLWDRTEDMVLSGDRWVDDNAIIYFNDVFADFFRSFIEVILLERICLERAFNKIKIKGGMCNPCCVRDITKIIMSIIINDLEVY